MPIGRTKKKPKQKSVEGSRQKQSGKWFHRSFPGREFDDLDAIRAAKRQRAEQRIAYSDQNIGRRSRLRAREERKTYLEDEASSRGVENLVRSKGVNKKAWNR